MATEAHELLVRIRSDGLDKTTDDLDELGSEFSEVADIADDEANSLTRFAKKWKGAMVLTVASLGVAAAGLLSMVPVISELFGGLKAILQAVALQLDRQLRPALQPVTEGMFELADAIASGDWEAVREIIGDFARAFAQIDWVGLFNDAMGALNAFLEGANLKPLIDSIFAGIMDFAGFAGRKLGAFLVGAIEAMPGGQLLLATGDAFIDVLGGLIAFARAATNAVKSFLGAMSFDEIVQKLSDGVVAQSKIFQQGIMELVRSIDWMKVGGAIKSQIEAAIRAQLAPGGAGTGDKRIVNTESSGFTPPPTGRGFTKGTDSSFRDFMSDFSGVSGQGSTTDIGPGTANLSVNLDSRTIAEETKQFNVQGVLGSGRGSRLR